MSSVGASLILPDLFVKRQEKLTWYEQALSDDASDRLQKAIPDEARSWCTPEALVGSGKAHREILRVARDRDAHVIVMGVHGQSGRPPVLRFNNAARRPSGNVPRADAPRLRALRSQSYFAASRDLR